VKNGLLPRVQAPAGNDSTQPPPASSRCSYAEAINQGLSQAMEIDDRVFVVGQLVDYKPGVFGTTTGLVEKFGPGRVHDFPVAESVMTAVAIGAALVGMRPVLIHHRLDFMLYSMDAIVNWLSLWRFKSNNDTGLPVVIRAIVGKGWGQGPQHSKSLHAWFAHLPGLRVAVPATAFDAKGLLMESIFGEDPAIIIEHRSLFGLVDTVPSQPYRVRYGKAAVRRKGKDITLVAIGIMVPLALRAAARLVQHSVDCEVIDLRTVSPLDVDSVCESVTRTGRLLVADPAWCTGSVAAEVIATVCEREGRRLRANPGRVCLPDSHTPMSSALEEAYYPNEDTMVRQILAQFQ
jgi:acetoin:2,6-dichlorophenolindophenol oxidoreductase subunit beta